MSEQDTTPSPPDSSQYDVPAEKMKEIMHVEMSIQHWSSQHMSLMLEARGIESTVQGLMERKRSVLDGILEDLDLDVGKYDIANISPEGKLTLRKKSE